MMALTDEQRREIKKKSDAEYARSPAGRAAQARTRERLKKDRNYKYMVFSSMLKHHYGIDGEDWARMYNAQNRLCKICLSFLEVDFKTCVDHCHLTGSVRGLICRRCNRGLGLFCDDVNLMLRAIEYLRNTHEDQHVSDEVAQVV